MDENIYFSVLIPTNNRAKDLDETLCQLQKSTFKNFEVIIIDNNSNDNTLEVSKKYSFVRYFKNNSNTGAIVARNQAMKKTKGKIIFSIDDDSFPSVFAMEKAYEAFEKNDDIALISCGIKNYKIFNNEINNTEEQSKNLKFNETSTWSGCGGFFRKSLYDKYGPWDESGINNLFELLTCLWTFLENKKIVNYENIYVYHKISDAGIGAELRGNDIMRIDEFLANAFFILKYFSYIKIIKKLSEMFYIISCATIEQKTTIYLKAYIKLLKNLKIILNNQKRYPSNITNKIRLSYNFIGR
jgi:glycosyltransferase involved in cell wall biosynthesis